MQRASIEHVKTIMLKQKILFVLSFIFVWLFFVFFVFCSHQGYITIANKKTIYQDVNIVEIGLFFFIKSFPCMKAHLKSHLSTKRES